MHLETEKELQKICRGIDVVNDVISNHRTVTGVQVQELLVAIRKSIIETIENDEERDSA